MRIARSLILLALAATAAMVFAAGVASAQEVRNSIDIVSEPNGAQCNPCEVMVEGEAHIVALPSGIRISQCRNNFHTRFYGRVGGNPARGETEWLGVNDNPPLNCTPVNCPQPEGHWPLTNFGSVGGGVGHFTARFCLNGGILVHCNAEVTVTANPTAHSYRFSATALCSGGTRRYEADGSTDSTGIEVVLV